MKEVSCHFIGDRIPEDKCRPRNCLERYKERCEHYKNLSAQEVYCSLLNKRVTRNRCLWGCLHQYAQREDCKSSAKSIEIFDYLKHALLIFNGNLRHGYFTGRADLYLMAHHLDDQTYEEVLHGGKVTIDFSGGIPYGTSIEKVKCIDVSWYGQYERCFEEEHKMGNKEIIFEYCKSTPAFRSPWVIRQIEVWKLENSEDGNKKIRKLISAYTKRRGKTYLDKVTSDLSRDRGIYHQFLEFRKEMDFKKALKETAQKRYRGEYLGTEAIREIQTQFRQIEDLESEAVSHLRRLHASGYPVFEVLSQGDLDPILVQVSKIGDAIKLLDRDLATYKQIRENYYGVTFEHGLNREREPEESKKDLKAIIEIYSREHGIEETYLKELYRDYRFHEATINNDIVSNDEAKYL